MSTRSEGEELNTLQFQTSAVEHLETIADARQKCASAQVLIHGLRLAHGGSIPPSKDRYAVFGTQKWRFPTFWDFQTQFGLERGCACFSLGKLSFGRMRGKMKALQTPSSLVTRGSEVLV